MLDDVRTDAWPQPLLGSVEVSGGVTGKSPMYRMTKGGKAFLVLVAFQALCLIVDRTISDLVFKLPVLASAGHLTAVQNTWFAISVVVSSAFNLLTACDGIANESTPAIFATLASTLYLCVINLLTLSYTETTCAKHSLSWLCVSGTFDHCCNL